MTQSQFMALASSVFLLFLWIDAALVWHLAAAAVVVPAVAHITQSNP